MSPTATARSLIGAAGDALLDERRQLSLDELAELAALPDSAVPSLAALAHEVRLAWCGPEVEVEGILSAKTGGCPEDCHFCSQSARFDTQVQATPFLDTDEVLAAAAETARMGASEFCIVLAVRGPDERTMQRLLELVPLVPRAHGAQRGGQRRHPLRRAGLAPRRWRRAPLQPQPRDGPLVLPVASSRPTPGRSGSTRVSWCANTAWSCAAGCCSGMGESSAQRIELIGQLREVGPAEVPLNFLNPRPGTPLADRLVVQPLEALRWIALFRLGLPSVILRYAGGREVTLRELQAMGMTVGHQRPHRRATT